MPHVQLSPRAATGTPSAAARCSRCAPPRRARGSCTHAQPNDRLNSETVAQQQQQKEQQQQQQQAAPQAPTAAQGAGGVERDRTVPIAVAVALVAYMGVAAAAWWQAYGPE